MEYALTKDLQKVFDLVERTSQNVFILGKPGVGKSYLINAILNLGQKFYTLTAPTGLAALNINGSTLHKIFGIPSGVISPDYDVYAENMNVFKHIKYSVKHLIIDEISMVRGDLFDYVNRVLQFCKGNSLPFGGVQLICVGDFYQLPPVVTGEDKKPLKEFGYKSPFVFDAHCFKQLDFKIVELKEVLRQKGDAKFIKLLDAVRVGHVNKRQCIELNKSVKQPEEFRVRLCAINKLADNINQAELNKLTGPSKTFPAIKYGDWPTDPIPEIVELRVGAQVIVKKNAADLSPKEKDSTKSKVVNGTIGKVVEINDRRLIEIEEEGEGEPPFIPTVVIETEKGTRHTIYRKRWEKKIREKDEDGQWSTRVVASFDQMPLVLAWAISIHKSQGQTFDKVHIDPSRVFAAGQLYVAFSRCKSQAGITLERKVQDGDFWADLRVTHFYEDLEQQLV